MPSSSYSSHGELSCKRFPAAVVFLLTISAVTSTFFSVISCDFLQVNRENKEINQFEEDSVGLFESWCFEKEENENIAQKYSSEDDTNWLVAQYSAAISVLLGFIAMALSVVLVSQCSADDSSKVILRWHIRGWRLLGICAGVCTLLNLLSFLIFDAKACRSEKQDCEIRLGSFLMICACVMFLSVVVITECTGPPVDPQLLDDDDEQGGYKGPPRGSIPYGDGEKFDDGGDDLKNITIDTYITDVEVGDGQNGDNAVAEAVYDHMSDITDDDLLSMVDKKKKVLKGRKYASLNDDNEIDVEIENRKGIDSGAVPAMNVLSPEALEVFDDVSFKTNASNNDQDGDNTVNNNENDFENPSAAYEKRMNKYGRQWDMHPDELLLPKALGTKKRLGKKKHSEYSMLGSDDEDDDKIDNSQLARTSNNRRTHHKNDTDKRQSSSSVISHLDERKSISKGRSKSVGVLPVPSQSTEVSSSLKPSKTYKSGESEEYLLHLLNDKRILDESTMSYETSGMDSPARGRKMSNTLPPGGRRRGRSTTPRSYGNYDTKMKHFSSAPSTPTGMYTYDSRIDKQINVVHKYIASNPNNDDARKMGLMLQEASSPVSKLTFDDMTQRSLYSPGRRPHLEARSKKYDLREQKGRRKPPPSLPIMLSPRRDDASVNHDKEKHMNKQSSKQIIDQNKTRKKISQNSSMPSFDEGASLIHRVKVSPLNLKQRNEETFETNSQSAALLDSSLSEDNASSVILGGTEKLGLNVDHLYGREKSTTSSVLYLGDEERKNAMRKLSSPVPFVSGQRSSSQSVTRGSASASPLRKVSYSPYRQNHASDKQLSWSSTGETTARSSSLPPVMRMRKLRQKLVKNRFSGKAQPQPSNRISFDKLSSRDQISPSVRDELGQAKFDWEEKRSKSNVLTMPTLSPLTSIGGDGVADDLSYDYRNDRFVPGRPYVTP